LNPSRELIGRDKILLSSAANPDRASKATSREKDYALVKLKVACLHKEAYYANVERVNLHVNLEISFGPVEALHKQPFSEGDFGLANLYGSPFLYT
jgi:hypothetical protein